MNQHIFVCGCERGGKVSPETVMSLRSQLEEKNIGYTYIQDMCGSIPSNPQDLIGIKESDHAVIIGCHPRAMENLLDYAIFCTCGTKIDYHHAETFLENGTISNIETDKDCVKKVEYKKDWKPWYPVIDYDRCTSCQKCLNFCLFGVYTKDDDNKVLVAQPANCKDLCPACARACPEQAIIFPKHHEGPIDGSNTEVVHQDDESILEKIQNEDVYSVLAQRRKKFKAPLLKAEQMEIAEEERRACCGDAKEDKAEEAKKPIETAKEKECNPDPNNPNAGSCCC